MGFVMTTERTFHNRFNISGTMFILSFPHFTDALPDHSSRYGFDYWGQEVRQGVEQFLKEHPQKEFRIEGEIGFISI